MKQGKQAFTLIELLAVIIILGIIALISIPLIQNSIYNSKREAFRISVYGIFDAYEVYELKNPFLSEKTNVLNLSLTHKENFLSGKVYRKENIIYVENVSDGIFCANGNLENLEVVDRACDLLDTTAPVILKVTSEVTENSIKVYTIYDEGESFLSKHEYRISKENENIEEKEWVSGDELTENLSTKLFLNLKEETTYKIQIRLTNTSLENNTSLIYETMISTGQITKSIIEIITEEEYAQSKKIKINCPNGDTCSCEYSFDKENWFSYQEEIEIEENGTIYVRCFEGEDKYEESVTISGIDKTEPTVELIRSQADEKIILTAKVEPENTNSGYHYTWYKDGNILTNELEKSIVVSDGGEYQVKVTTGAGVEKLSEEITIRAFTITYDLNGGEGEIPNGTKIENLPYKVVEQIPTKGKLTFIGWGLTEDALTPSYIGGDLVSEDQDLTLYAIWKVASLEGIIETNPYSYYLYFKFKGDSTEHVYLSDTRMGIMEHYSDDATKRKLSIPSYYRPNSTYTTGDYYQFIDGEWQKVVTNGTINQYFENLVGDDAKLENIDNWFDAFCHNYTIDLYKNISSGFVSLYSTKKSDVCDLSQQPNADPTIYEVVSKDPHTSTNDPNGNKRYVGSSVNNYVRFNNELWRIIGIINGNVKIIKSSSIGKSAWNSSTTSNDWKSSSLYQYLNTSYYNSIGDYYRPMIQNGTWRVGGYSSSAVRASTMYNYEGNKNGKGSTSTIAIGYIGLMSASDYAYACSCATTSKSLLYYDSSECTYNWLKLGSNEWTLTPSSSYTKYAYLIGYGGAVIIGSKYSSTLLNSANEIRPVLYLKSNVRVTGGTGNSSDPYTLTQY